MCDTVVQMNDFERLLEAVSFVARDRDPESIHRKTLIAARQLTGARYAAFSIMEHAQAATDTFQLADISIDGEDDLRELRSSIHLPEGTGILGELLRSRQVLRIADLAKYPHFSGFPAGHPHMTSFLGTVVHVGDQTFGELYLADKDGGKPFTKRDEDLIVALAGLAAVRLENVAFSMRLREFALISERQRIARDLHDSVIQRLFAVGLTLQSSLRSTDATAVHQSVQHAVDDLEDTIDDIRSVIFALQSGQENTHPLRMSILTIASDNAELLGFEPRVRFSGPVDSMLSDELSAEILRVVRELFSNVVRHAKASHAELTVSVSSAVTVEMIDNGCGIAGPRKEGLGLRNLEDRAKSHGGSMAILRRKSGGTRIVWKVPRDASHDVL